MFGLLGFQFVQNVVFAVVKGFTRRPNVVGRDDCGALRCSFRKAFEAASPFLWRRAGAARVWYARRTCFPPLAVRCYYCYPLPVTECLVLAGRRPRVFFVCLILVLHLCVSFLFTVSLCLAAYVAACTSSIARPLPRFERKNNQTVRERACRT